jgi:hypothetical protein
MSIFNWKRKKGPKMYKSAKKGQGTSLLKITQQSGISTAPATCDKCKHSFSWPIERIMNVSLPSPYMMEESEIAKHLDRWEIDTGGYCPVCKKLLCADHLVFVESPMGFIFGMVPGCGKCGTPIKPK